MTDPDTQGEDDSGEVLEGQEQERFVKIESRVAEVLVRDDEGDREEMVDEAKDLHQQALDHTLALDEMEKGPGGMHQ